MERSLEGFDVRVANVKGALQADRGMMTRLVCPRCNAGLVPSWSGLRCPRMTACGRGGPVETVATGYVFAWGGSVPSGIRA